VVLLAISWLLRAGAESWAASWLCALGIGVDEGANLDAPSSLTNKDVAASRPDDTSASTSRDLVALQIR
jgi:hypothetical protein